MDEAGATLGDAETQMAEAERTGSLEMAKLAFDSAEVYFDVRQRGTPEPWDGADAYARDISMDAQNLIAGRTARRRALKKKQAAQKPVAYEDSGKGYWHDTMSRAIGQPVKKPRGFWGWFFSLED